MFAAYQTLRRKLFVMVMVTTGLVGGSAFAEEGVAIVGKGEATSIVRNLLGTEADEVSLMPFEEGLAGEGFSRFKMVILAPDVTERYTSEDSQAIKDYVVNGGRLLLIAQAPKLLHVTVDGNDKGEDYLFGRSYYFRDEVQCDVLLPEDPLLKGVMDKNPSPHWLSASVMLKNPEFENLIGGKDYTLVGRARFGKGVVYYVGHELFRMQLPQRPERHADAESWKILLVNIVIDKSYSHETP